nr:uroporphyrinogen-III synthase [Tessaracoccus aquimaris]
MLLPRPDGALADGIRAAGAEVVAVPLQRTVAIRPTDWPTDADWVALTSPATLDVLDGLGLTLPEGARIAVVGSGTARSAVAHGLTVDRMPAGGVGSARALLDAWPQGSDRILIPGSARASGELASGLLAKGHVVTPVDVYTVETLPTAPAAVKGDYQGAMFDVVVVTSGSVAEAVDALLGWPSGTSVVALGEPSAAALVALGVTPDAVAATQDADGVIAAIATTL